MRKHTCLLLLAGVVALGLTTAVSSQPLSAGELGQGRKSYIVALADQSPATRRAFVSSIRALGGTIGKTYEHVFSGYSVTVDAGQLATLQALNGVSAVYPDIQYAAPAATPEGFTAADGYDSYSQETVNTDYSLVPSKGAGVSIAVIDTGLFYNQVSASASDTSSKAFRPLEAGIATSAAYETVTGNTASLGLHGSDFKTVNNKIIFEYDYADADNNVQPLAGDEHGTHVASLAAANGYLYQGMAPNAQLGIMKVFSNTGDGAATEDIIAALDDAYALDFDIVNMSLGIALLEYPGMSGNAEGLAIKALQDKGVSVNIAAGNDGRGQWSNIYANQLTTDSVEPSQMGGSTLMGYGNIVASSNLDKSFADLISVGEQSFTYTDQVDALPFVNLFAANPSMPYVYTGGTGASSEYAGLDASGKIAVVNRGTSTFTDKVAAAEAAKAVGIVIINNVEDDALNMAFDTEPNIPVAFVSMSAKAVFSDATTGIMTVAKDVVSANGAAHQVSDYSSDGGTTALGMGPTIAAPGDNILGAVNGDYERYSGTSMATPNFSGIEALLLAEHPGDTAYRDSLIARVQSTADILNDATAAEEDSHNFASPRTQGAGQADVSRTAQATAFAQGIDATGAKSSYAALEFGQDAAFSAGLIKPEFWLTNESSSAVAYQASVYIAVPEVAVGITDAEYAGLNDFGMAALPKSLTTTDFAQVDDHLIGFRENYDSFTVGANAVSQHVVLDTIDITAEFGAEVTDYIDANFPDGTYLEGYVVLTPVDGTGTALNLPYLGFFGDYGKAAAAEAFDFEKGDATKAYNSDLLNSVVKAITGLTSGVDFGSHIYGTSGLSDYDTAFENKLAGFAPLEDTIGAVQLGDKSTGGITAGVKGQSDQLLIQEYMNRDALSGSVALTGASSSAVLSSTKLTGYPFYDIYSDEGYPDLLFKSYPSQSSVTGGWYAPMAIGKIDLKDGSGNPLAVGQYNLTFTYELLATDAQGNHFTQTKTIPLTIAGNTGLPYGMIQGRNGGYSLAVAPDITKVKIAGVDGLQTAYSAADGSYNTVIIPQMAGLKTFLEITAYGKNGSAVTALYDMRSKGTFAILGSNLNQVDSFYFTKTVSGKEIAFAAKALQANGYDASVFLYNAHGFSVYVGDVDPTGVKVNLGNGQTRTLGLQDYGYNQASGVLTVYDLEAGETDFTITIK